MGATATSLCCSVVRSFGRSVGMRLLLLLVLCMTAVGRTCEGWKGGVVDFTPTPFTTRENAASVAGANLASYRAALWAAANGGVEFVVFPEFGVSSGHVFSGAKSDQRGNVGAFAQPLPDAVGVLPCNNTAFNASWMLQTLSCASAETRVWLAANLVEAGEDGKIYNAEVVLNGDGVVVAKYRKSHVWFKHAFDQPEHPDLVSFTADFSSGFQVQMGLMVCFDIAHHSPGTVLASQGIKVFPYSASEGFVGPEIVKTWSALHNTTVLASNDDGHSSFYHAGHAIPHTAIPVAANNVLLVADLQP